MKKYDILSADDKVAFDSIYDALNDCFGKDYKAWMKACWPSYSPEKFRAWFPKLAPVKNGVYQAAVNGCINTITPDWEEVIFDDLKKSFDGNYYTGLDLIFAKDVDGKYVFRGVYKLDMDKTIPNHYVSRRVATKVQLLGDPVYDVRLL